MKLISTLVNRALASILVITLLCFSQTSNAAPPVFWNVFDVKVQDNRNVNLNWLVTEYNNKAFWVQHSTDGYTWTEVVRIPSKDSPESLEDYSFTHTNSQEGRNFYRIKHTDVNEYTTGYSMVRVVVVTREAKPGPVVSPNPATDHISFTNEDGKFVSATIVNLTGKSVADSKLVKNSNTLDVRSLAKGIYFLQLRKVNGESETVKFVKM
jgi:hypothetical protein